MNLDLSRVNSILAQSDEQLYPKVAAVMDALGLSPHAKEKVLSDLPALRERAQTLTEADVYKARRMLGDEQLQNLVSMLENHG